MFMDKRKIKRALFFWIDKLQITKKERVTVTVLLSIIIVLLLTNLVIKQRIVPMPENHAEIQAEFERKSEGIEREKLTQEQKYAGIEINETIEPEVLTKELVDINTATIEELQSLSGIGETYALRIVEYREANGKFNSVEELVHVKGIGKRTLDKIKPFIKL